MKVDKMYGLLDVTVQRSNCPQIPQNREGQHNRACIINHLYIDRYSKLIVFKTANKFTKLMAPCQ